MILTFIVLQVKAMIYFCILLAMSHQTHHVEIQVLLNVNITLYDGVEGGLMDMVSQDSTPRKEKGKELLCTPEPLIAHVITWLSGCS